MGFDLKLVQIKSMFIGFIESDFICGKNMPYSQTLSQYSK